MSGFYKALPFVLDAEGGLADDPDDRGGLTNYGVTQRTYDDWRRSVGQPPRSVVEIELGEAHAIYHQNYWLAGKCDALPWPVSRAHFDACVNHGPKTAIMILQRALDVDDDGDFGPKTMHAADLADVYDLMDRLLWERLAVYADIAKVGNQRKFLRGWLLRVIRLRRLAWR